MAGVRREPRGIGELRKYAATRVAAWARLHADNCIRNAPPIDVTAIAIKKGPTEAGPFLYLFLLLAFRMRFVAVFVSGLRMLLGGLGVLLALVMFTFAVVFGSSAMGLGRMFMMLGSFVVLVFRHDNSP
jgi:hypothetical protein